MRTPRLLAALAAAPLIFLAACSSDDATDDATSTEDAAATDDAAGTDDAAATSAAPEGDFELVDVETGDEPVLTYDGEPFAESGSLPLRVAETEEREVEAGDGDEVAEGDDVRTHIIGVNATSGEVFIDSFAEDAPPTMPLSNETLIPAIRDTLPGKKVGGSYLVAAPAADAFGPQGQPQMGLGPDDSVVLFVQIEDTGQPLEQAEGEEVTDLPDGLPKVEADGQSAAQIEVEGVESPSELVVQPLIEGEGAEVLAGQTIKVHYTGVSLESGEQFDSSYDRDMPSEFGIGMGQVIQGWDEGLVGQKVGSRVLLVVPSDMAYGEQGTGDGSLADEDLVFVVDILGAY